MHRLSAELFFVDNLPDLSTAWAELLPNGNGFCSLNRQMWRRNYGYGGSMALPDSFMTYNTAHGPIVTSPRWFAA
jgi:hypothetical protein